MALKDFNFQQFMIEKGERVVLGLVGGLTTLLILFGFVMRGLGSGSPAANTRELNELRKKGQDAFTRSAPDLAIAKVDPDLLRAGQLVPLDPIAFLAENPFFEANQMEDTKWRLPRVLAPDESQVDLVRGLVRSYIFTRDRDSMMVMFLHHKQKKDASGAAGRGRIQQLQRLMGGGKGGPGAPGGMMGMGMMGGRGGMGMRGGGEPGMPGMPGMGGPGGMMGMMGGMYNNGTGEKQELEFLPVPLERLAKDDTDVGRNAWPAEMTIPHRMALIQAAFPYKEQMEEFRRALRYHTLGDMEMEAAAEFTGLNVKRREIGPDGKPGDWHDFDYVKTLKPLLVFGREPEDVKLLQYGIVWHRDRLAVPLPMLAREQKYPEQKLQGIKKTIEALDKIAKESQLPIYEQKTKFDLPGFDIFDSEPNAGSSGNANAAMPGMPGMPGMSGRMGGGIGPDEGSGMKMPGGARGGMMMKGQGGAPRMGMPGMMQGMPPEMGGPGGMGMMGGYGMMTSENRLLADKCLVRFVDVTVQPGHTYEYQVQIRMANPLYKKPEKAITLDYTKEKEVKSDWATIPHRLRVPEEVEFYVVEERRARNSANNAERLWVQVHRWIDWQQVAPNNRDAVVPVGDWSVAEQSPAVRGEYIGRTEDVQVPTWYPLQEEFGFAIPPAEKRRPGVRRQATKGIKVDFATRHILVDFQGGKQDVPVKKDGREVRVKDEYPIEALVLTADGKLVVRSGKADTGDAARKERVKEWHEWIKEVKEGGDRAKAHSADNPFGPAGGPPGGPGGGQSGN